MATPVEALRRRSFRQKTPSTFATTPNSAIFSSFSNQVLLHDWWLVRSDSDSHGKRLGIGGFTFKEGRGIRCFSSAPVVKRQDAVTLKTVDGITIMVLGYLNRSRTLENGFSHELCDHFLIGFPYYWEEFAGLSVSEETADISGSKAVSCSDAYKPPAPGDHRTNMLSKNTFDSLLSEASSGKKGISPPILSVVPVNHLLSEASSGKKGISPPILSVVPVNHKKTKTEERSRDYFKKKEKSRDSSNVESVEHKGPLTRSRARMTTRTALRGSMRLAE